MKICYRDNNGTVSVSISPDYPITFDGRYAYFSDITDRDYRIPVSDIVKIAQEE